MYLNSDSMSCVVFAASDEQSWRDVLQEALGRLGLKEKLSQVERPDRLEIRYDLESNTFKVKVSGRAQRTLKSQRSPS